MKLSHALFGALLLSAAGFSNAAHATCSLTGKWHSLTIADGSNNTKGAGTMVHGCRVTIAKNGSFTGNCRSQALGEAAPSDTTATGKLTVNSKCEMSGVWKVAGYADTKVLIGYVSGNLAIFSGVRGSPAFQVRSVTLIRD